DLQQELEALGGDKPEVGDALLEQLVGGHGGAVHDGGCFQLAEFLYAGDEPVRGIRGGRRGLGGDDVTGLLVDRDHVGERAAVVDSDSDATHGSSASALAKHFVDDPGGVLSADV